MIATTSSPGPSILSPGSPQDTSSLRAAALKTLKTGKRRRPASGQAQITPLTRPVPQDTLQLDYGQDDNTSEPPQALAKAPSPPSSPPRIPPPVSHPIPETDMDMREEGEISDEEPPAEVNLLKPAQDQADGGTNLIQNDQPSIVPVSPRPGSPMPALLTRLSMTQSPASNSPTSSIPYVERARSFPAMDISRGSTGPPATYFSGGSPRGQGPFARESFTRSVTPGSGYVSTYDPTGYGMAVDRHDIRPGLSSKFGYVRGRNYAYLAICAVTQMEYDAAKDIVLDLLGWGVPPQYLVDCGLSKELVYYVFTDLRLRLPPNLDIPRIPNESERLSSGSPAHTDYSSGSHLTSRIGGPIDELQAPAPPDLTTYSTPLTNAPAAVVTPTPEELEDMERQRRQELLARKKAVLASRKAKRPIDHDSSTAQSPVPAGSDIDVAMAPPASTETVEDFLNSIGPAKQVSIFRLYLLDPHRYSSSGRNSCS